MISHLDAKTYSMRRIVTLSNAAIIARGRFGALPIPIISSLSSTPVSRKVHVQRPSASFAKPFKEIDQFGNTISTNRSTSSVASSIFAWCAVQTAFPGKALFIPSRTADSSSWSSCSAVSIFSNNSLSWSCSIRLPHKYCVIVLTMRILPFSVIDRDQCR